MGTGFWCACVWYRITWSSVLFLSGDCSFLSLQKDRKRKWEVVPSLGVLCCGRSLWQRAVDATDGCFWDGRKLAKRGRRAYCKRAKGVQALFQQFGKTQMEIRKHAPTEHCGVHLTRSVWVPTSRCHAKESQQLSSVRQFAGREDGEPRAIPEATGQREQIERLARLGHSASTLSLTILPILAKSEAREGRTHSEPSRLANHRPSVSSQELHSLHGVGRVACYCAVWLSSQPGGRWWCLCGWLVLEQPLLRNRSPCFHASSRRE